MFVPFISTPPSERRDLWKRKAAGVEVEVAEAVEFLVYDAIPSHTLSY